MLFQNHILIFTLSSSKLVFIFPLPPLLCYLRSSKKQFLNSGIAHLLRFINLLIVHYPRNKLTIFAFEIITRILKQNLQVFYQTLFPYMANVAEKNYRCLTHYIFPRNIILPHIIYKCTHIH